MDLLDRFLGHDAWTTRSLLDICGDLSDEQLDREFDIGLGTVRATLDHVIFNMEVWSGLMAGTLTREGVSAIVRDKAVPGMRARLDAAAADLADVAHSVAAREGWDERWLDVLDDPPNEKTFGGAIAHVITHDTHHAAHVLYMLRMLGVTDLPELDVLYWEWRHQ